MPKLEYVGTYSSGQTVSIANVNNFKISSLDGTILRSEFSGNKAELLTQGITIVQVYINDSVYVALNLITGAVTCTSGIRLMLFTD